MTALRSPWGAAVLAALLALLLLLPGLGGAPFDDPGEGQHAEIAREAWVSGDLLDLRFNGVRYFDKPPLLYWLIALDFRAWGQSEWAARLPSVAGAAAAAAATALLGARLLVPGAGLLAAIALLSSALFVVFGRVVRGTNVLNIYNSFVNWSGLVVPPRNTNLVLHQYYQAPFDDLPLLQPNTYDSNFLYLEITLLQLTARLLPGGGRLLSWNSPTGMTNIVEFTTSLPPVWQTLVQTNGTGSQLSIIDSTAADKTRMYRIRVPY